MSKKRTNSKCPQQDGQGWDHYFKRSRKKTPLMTWPLLLCTSVGWNGFFSCTSTWGVFICCKAFSPECSRYFEMLSGMQPIPTSSSPLSCPFPVGCPSSKQMKREGKLLLLPLKVTDTGGSLGPSLGSQQHLLIAAPIDKIHICLSALLENNVNICMFYQIEQAPNTQQVEE